MACFVGLFSKVSPACTFLDVVLNLKLHTDRQRQTETDGDRQRQTETGTDTDKDAGARARKRHLSCFFPAVAQEAPTRALSILYR